MCKGFEGDYCERDINECLQVGGVCARVCGHLIHGWMVSLFLENLCRRLNNAVSLFVRPTADFVFSIFASLVISHSTVNN